ncbi:MAG: formyl transferase [Coriobacteriia bacterium]|nr:formyl transferase [Coriobacteriia bacterium]
MKVLLLGPERPQLEATILASGDQVVRTEGRIEPGDPMLDDADFLVSFGYRYLIPADVLHPFGHRAVNLHISLLPWNRGADPNLWSYLEDTPKGVTIHVLDEGLDTGPIIAQREVAEEPDDTLRTSYGRLTREILALFAEVWPLMRAEAIEPVAQVGGGTTHQSADKASYERLLTLGWDTPVTSLIGRAL